MYERFFGLRELPFRLTPDPNYLFLSRKHGEAFAHLLYAVREGSGFVAITGEIGAGKTTLIRTLLRELRDTREKVAAAYIFNPVYSSLELLQSINAELGLPSRSTSKKELTESLNDFLLSQKIDGGRTVVIVDEAQNLDPQVLEELRLLSNLETETEKLVHIVLIGQPELRDLLERPELLQLAQRITVRWHLASLSRSETFDYVRHRMRIAGGSQHGDTFDVKALGSLYEHSGGVPRLINILAHRALLVAYTKGSQKVGAAEVNLAASELEEGRYPIVKLGRRWLYRAAAGIGVAAAAAGVAFLLLAPLGGDDGSAMIETPPQLPEAQPAQAKVTAAEAPESSPASDRAAEKFLKRLSRTSTFDAATTAVSALFRAWERNALSQEEISADAFELEAVAKARGLNYLAGKMGIELIRAIDLPVILELEVPGDTTPRYAMLASLDSDEATLTAEKNVSMSRGALMDVWNGNAHILWKDHERFRRSMGPGSGGPAVLRLQALLREAGLYDGIVNGIYGDDAEKAVRDFQTAHRLAADGVAGPVTQILLYNSIARFSRPELTPVTAAGGRAS